MRVIEHLVKTLRDSAIFNPEIQVPPSCILWPDKDRQWEAVIPRLQSELAELLVLGDYTPENRTGPAIWLRCVVDRVLEDVSLEPGVVPILYLPGVARETLRAAEECPKPLQLLAWLVVGGSVWKLLVAAGDAVKAGDTIAVIEALYQSYESGQTTRVQHS
jgi:hypothetical protein